MECCCRLSLFFPLSVVLFDTSSSDWTGLASVVKTGCQAEHDSAGKQFCFLSRSRFSFFFLHGLRISSPFAPFVPSL